MYARHGVTEREIERERERERREREERERGERERERERRERREWQRDKEREETCADPDIFLRGGGFCHFFTGDWANIFPKGGVQPNKMHKNAYKMDKNNVFLETSRNSRGVRTPGPPPSGSVHGGEGERVEKRDGGESHTQADAHTVARHFTYLCFVARQIVQQTMLCWRQNISMSFPVCSSHVFVKVPLKFDILHGLLSIADLSRREFLWLGWNLSWNSRHCEQKSLQHVVQLPMASFILSSSSQRLQLLSNTWSDAKLCEPGISVPLAILSRFLMLLQVSTIQIYFLHLLITKFVAFQVNLNMLILILLHVLRYVMYCHISRLYPQAFYTSQWKHQIWWWKLFTSMRSEAYTFSFLVDFRVHIHHTHRKCHFRLHVHCSKNILTRSQ